MISYMYTASAYSIAETCQLFASYLYSHAQDCYCHCCDQGQKSKGAEQSMDQAFPIPDSTIMSISGPTFDPNIGSVHLYIE